MLLKTINDFQTVCLDFVAGFSVNSYKAILSCFSEYVITIIQQF